MSDPLDDVHTELCCPRCSITERRLCQAEERLAREVYERRKRGRECGAIRARLREALVTLANVTDRAKWDEEHVAMLEAHNAELLADLKRAVRLLDGYEADVDRAADRYRSLMLRSSAVPPDRRS